jgi:hypothetical protein
MSLIESPVMTESPLVKRLLWSGVMAASGEPEPAQTASGLPNPRGLREIAVERPEVAVGAAFAGGLVFALILKRLAR